jgi:hypothetical protein
MMVLDILMASTSLCDAIALTAIWTSKKVIALAMTGLAVAIGLICVESSVASRLALS